MNRGEFNFWAFNGPIGQAQVSLAPYLPYAYTSVSITAGNANPFDIDPEQTVPILTGNTNAFDIDPEQTTLITAGLTSSD